MGRKDIDNLEIYRISMQIGDMTYQLVYRWESFDKNTIKYQLVRAVDSIAANISEGYGRFHFKEQRQYCYIARGSLYESKTWLNKAKIRISSDRKSVMEIIELLDNLHLKLNAYIKYIERNILP